MRASLVAIGRRGATIFAVAKPEAFRTLEYYNVGRSENFYMQIV